MTARDLEASNTRWQELGQHSPLIQARADRSLTSAHLITVFVALREPPSSSTSARPMMAAISASEYGRPLGTRLPLLGTMLRALP